MATHTPKGDGRMISAERWTPEIDAEADALYRTFSEAKIRRYQDLCSQQMILAYQQRNAAALSDLQKMENALTREMLRRYR